MFLFVSFFGCLVWEFFIAFRTFRNHLRIYLHASDFINIVFLYLSVIFPVDVDASGAEDGEHHGPREQGGGGEVPTPPGQGANSLHIHRSQGENSPQPSHPQIPR